MKRTMRVTARGLRCAALSERVHFIYVTLPLTVLSLPPAQNRLLRTALSSQPGCDFLRIQNLLLFFIEMLDFLRILD